MTSIISCIHFLSERHRTCDSLKKKYISPFYASFQFGIYIAQKITAPFSGDVSIWLSVPFLEMVIEVSTWTGLRGCISSSNTSLLRSELIFRWSATAGALEKNRNGNMSGSPLLGAQAHHNITPSGKTQLEQIKTKPQPRSSSYWGSGVFLKYFQTAVRGGGCGESKASVQTVY